MRYYTTFSFTCTALLVKSLSALAYIPNFPQIVNTTSPLTLAIKPACGSLKSVNFTEINTGVIWNATRTIVSFGDSWTSNGANGTVPVPPIMHYPLPFAGSELTENRRGTNGFMWVEDIANFLGAKLLNYAWGGAVVDITAYNSTKNQSSEYPPVARTDFNFEMKLFKRNGYLLDTLDPSETLYTVAFGINDNGQYSIAGGDWNITINTYLNQLGVLQEMGAQNFVIHGMYTSHPGTNELQNMLFQYLVESHAVNGTNFAFVDLYHLFSSIATTPEIFGYGNNGTSTCLVNANTVVGGCNDPDSEVFYIPGHPSRQTHLLIADYTELVVKECLVS